MLRLLADLFMADDEVESSANPDPHLAAAALMYEVVWADHDTDDAELQAMTRLLQGLFSLSDTQAQDYLQRAQRLHATSVGLHEFTRALNDYLNADDKYTVVHGLWLIALADEQVTPLEEHMIRRIADLLYVSHKDFIRAKLQAREQLSTDR